jgi:N-acetyl-gamma-glutamyl-phosphate reductase
MAQRVQTAVVGASGYTGEELLSVLLRHPNVDLRKVTSRQQAGSTLGSYFGFTGNGASLKFEDIVPGNLAGEADVFFLALPHGVAAEYAVPLIKAGKTVFDLSADFRLKDQALYKEFYHHDHPAPELSALSVYGIPELYRSALKSASLVACPGCYPTSVILGLAPALKNGLIDSRQIVVNSLSGVSGAGRKADIALTYCEVNENMKAYSVPVHRHLPEIEQELSLLAGKPLLISFTPHLVPLIRGMISTISAPLQDRNLSEEKADALFREFYKDEPFVNVLPQGELPEARRVARTNRCDVAVRVDKRTGRLVIISGLDNLGKGAAGQAVQAFNVRFGLPETTGLFS